MNKTIRIAVFLCLTALFSSGCLFPGQTFQRPNQVRNSPPPIIEQIKYLPPIQHRNPNSPYDQLSVQSLAAVKEGNFQWLEDAADKARKNKERMPGGYWKLHAIYRGVTEPDAGTRLGEQDWEKHIKKIEEWKNRFPQSITARVALADTWIGFAWEARGTGMARTVSEANWRLFRERLAVAEKELLEAKKLDAVCPEWYATALRLGRVNDWSRKEYERIFEEAFRLEPTYYHIQRAKIMYLLPQWNGKEGEWAKFTTEITERVGGDEGRMMYFMLVGNMQEEYGGGIFRRNDLSWEKAKEGYAALEKICGTDNYRLNQYAALAFYAEDMPAAQTAFEKIGDNWDYKTWEQKRLFDEAKLFAARYNEANASRISKESNHRSHKKTSQNP